MYVLLFSNSSVVVKFCLFLCGTMVEVIDFSGGAVLISP